MPLKTRLFLVGLSTLLGAAMVIWGSPVAVSNGLRLWVWWKSRQEGLAVSIDKIDAPFLRPVVIRSLHITTPPAAAFHIDLTAAGANFDLNLNRILLYRRGHAIRNLSIENLHGEIRRDKPNLRGITQRGWRTLHRLLPQKFNLHSSEMRVQGGPSLILLRNCVLSASDIEAGRFSAGEVMIASPWLRQTFSQLRGATRWDADRLTLAGLTLTRGLDVESIAADFSRLGSQRVGLEFDADAFGGKIRSTISHEWRSKRQNWKVAGAGTDISLAQTSEAIGLTDHFGGLLRACNFTFRGNLADPARVTASLWTEMTGLTWRNRTAEAIMLGASLYNQQVQLQQLYIKQKTNQLTLSGQASFPSKSSDWLRPDFRGDISATINSLRDFTSLFGANSGDFAGAIAIDGTINTRERKIGGHLTVAGNSLSIFKTQIDNLTAKLNLKATELEIEQLELDRKQDFVRVQGKIDLTHGHDYSGTLSASISNLADYLGVFGKSGSTGSPLPATVGFTVDSSVWQGYAAVAIPNSKPITFAAVSLPLRIGESWTEFSMTPLKVSLSFVNLSLENAPRWPGLGNFRSGILSGALEVSGTLQRPTFEGEIDLIDGQTKDESLGFTGISGRVRLDGNHGLIDFLRIIRKDADVSFRGEVEVRDADDLTITLTSNLPVFDVTSYPLDCVSRVMVSRIDTMFAPIVSEIKLAGGLIDHNWTITLRPTARQLDEPMNLGDRTIPLCFRAWPTQGALMLSAYSPPSARPQKRAKHR